MVVTASYREADRCLPSPARAPEHHRYGPVISSGLICSGSDSTRHKDTQTDDKVTFIYSGSQNSTIS